MSGRGREMMLNPHEVSLEGWASMWGMDYRAIDSQEGFDALEPGGVFVNADCCMSDDPSERQQLYAHWAAHQVANGIPEARAWAHFEEWAGEDTYLPLELELDAFRSAGFEAERVWNDGPIF